MKNISFGISSIVISVALFSFVQVKTVDDIACVDESGVANSVWFVYSAATTANSSTILLPASYTKATGELCDGTERLSAICAVPQAGNPSLPNLTQTRIQTALANYNFSATTTLDPSGVILECDH